MLNKTQIRYCLDTMADMYPEAHCELVHDNPFELVIAVALSAQCTDVLVNKVTRNLFQNIKTPEDYLSVSLEELQQDIPLSDCIEIKQKHSKIMPNVIR